jgi:tetratricopeptide (TPR) repeat protein
MRPELCSRVIFALVLITLMSACVTAPQSALLRQEKPPDFLAPVLLGQVPFFAQSLYQCGPAALATLLYSSGVEVTPEQLVPLVYVPAREGSFQVEMLAATRSYDRLAYQIVPTMATLLTEVAAGRPVLVLQNLALNWYPRWHFAVVKGFDLERNRVILNSGLYEDYEMSLANFERTWARADYWGFLALAPGEMPAVALPGPYFSALAALGQSSSSADLRAAYTLGLQNWPSDRNLLMAYGNLLYAEDSKEAALQPFLTLVALEPEYAPAHNNLATVLHALGRDAQALEHARIAVTLGGDFLANYRATLHRIDPHAE